MHYLRVSITRSKNGKTFPKEVSSITENMLNFFKKICLSFERISYYFNPYPAGTKSDKPLPPE